MSDISPYSVKRFHRKGFAQHNPFGNGVHKRLNKNIMPNKKYLKYAYKPRDPEITNHQAMLMRKEERERIRAEQKATAEQS